MKMRVAYIWTCIVHVCLDIVYSRVECSECLLLVALSLLEEILVCFVHCSTALLYVCLHVPVIRSLRSSILLVHGKKD